MAEGGLTAHRRRLALGALALLVVLLHAGVGEVLSDHLIDLRPQGRDATRPLQRMEVSYVRELSIEAPPARGGAPAPRPSAAPQRAAPLQAMPAASAASVPDEPVAVAAEQPASAPLPEPSMQAAEVALAQASSPSSAPVSADAMAEGPRFDWPVSTRVSYVLTGNYQGEIHGSGQVEWVRVGDRYQVHVEVIVGLSIAPMMSRRMTSEGVVTPRGLMPLHYQQVTKQAFSPERELQMHFDEPGLVVMPTGVRRAALPGLQDSASQFVQMLWWFGTQPERLQPGQRIEVPLALPRSVDVWTYEVGEEETLYTPFGALQALPVKTRRVARAGGDMVPQMWFAPSLRYLPVRIRIHQDADTFVDLMISRKPQLAAP